MGTIQSHLVWTFRICWLWYDWSLYTTISMCHFAHFSIVQHQDYMILTLFSHETAYTGPSYMKQVTFSPIQYGHSESAGCVMIGVCMLQLARVILLISVQYYTRTTQYSPLSNETAYTGPKHMKQVPFSPIQYGHSESVGCVLIGVCML